MERGDRSLGRAGRGLLLASATLVFVAWASGEPGFTTPTLNREVSIPNSSVEAARTLTAGSGQQFGFVHRLLTRGGRWYIAFHRASYFFGDRAIAEFHADHPSISYGPPDGYYVRDTYKPGDQLIELPLSSQATVMTLFYTKEGKFFLENYRPDEFVNALSLSKQVHLWQVDRRGTPFWMSVRSGEVALLANQFMP